MAKKIRNLLLKNGIAYSTFGVLKFDAEGILTEPELTDEQKQTLLALKSFDEIEVAEEGENGNLDKENQPNLEDTQETKEEVNEGVEQDSTVVTPAEFAGDINQDENEVAETNEETNIDEMTVKQLKAFAEEKGIELTKTRRDEIIAEIKEALK